MPNSCGVAFLKSLVRIRWMMLVLRNVRFGTFSLLVGVRLQCACQMPHAHPCASMRIRPLPRKAVKTLARHEPQGGGKSPAVSDPSGLMFQDSAKIRQTVSIYMSWRLNFSAHGKQEQKDRSHDFWIRLESFLDYASHRDCVDGFAKAGWLQCFDSLGDCSGTGAIRQELTSSGSVHKLNYDVNTYSGRFCVECLTAKTRLAAFQWTDRSHSPSP